MINYTSDTTSNLKGVMIPYRAIDSNAQFGFEKLGHEL
jgi:long-chain acyl-CoA synthetase